MSKLVHFYEMFYNLHTGARMATHLNVINLQYRQMYMVQKGHCGHDLDIDIFPKMLGPPLRDV